MHHEEWKGKDWRDDGTEIKTKEGLKEIRGGGRVVQVQELILTSKGVERVTVGELRLRGRRTWGSWRWLLEEEEEEEGVDAGARAEAPPGSAAEVLAPSSVSCQ